MTDSKVVAWSFFGVATVFFLIAFGLPAISPIWSPLTSKQELVASIIVGIVSLALVAWINHLQRVELRGPARRAGKEESNQAGQ